MSDSPEELDDSRHIPDVTEDAGAQETSGQYWKAEEDTRSFVPRPDGVLGSRDESDSRESASPPLPEQIGKYVIVDLLDQGGQSIVYRGLDRDLSRDVVIKINRIPLSGGESGRDALLQQGKLVARLEHPHLDRVFELGIHEGCPFLVMQYAPGLNLAQYLKQQTLTPEQQATLVAKVARAVAAAHSQGVIHRDIKPANIIVDEAGQPRVIDFGMAWLRDAWVYDDDPGGVSGTLQYMSPEQALGEAVDHRSDIFALGALSYVLATGKAPFSASSRMEALKRARECDFDHDALGARGIPRGLRRICLRAMQTVPDDRYQTAEDLAEDLDRFVRRGQHRGIYATAIAAVLLLVAGLVWRASRPGQDTVSSPSSHTSQSSTSESADSVSAVDPQSLETDAMRVLVWQNDYRYELDQAVPLRTGDDLRIEWRLPPGYFGTFFWFDTEGILHELSASDSTDPDDTELDEAELDEADSDGAITLQWPGPGKSNVLAGPSGTEVIFLCASDSAPPHLEDVNDLLDGKQPWPKLTGASLLRFDSHTVELHGPRLRGPSEVDRERPEEQARLRADALRQHLAEKFHIVQGVAFPHVD